MCNSFSHKREMSMLQFILFLLINYVHQNLNSKYLSQFDTKLSYYTLISLPKNLIL
jgi:hypothetical protein